LQRLIPPVLAPGALRHRPQPTLPFDGCVLRPWQASDAPAVRAAYSDLAIQRWHLKSLTDIEAGRWIDSWAGRWEDETGAGGAATVVL
jgi:hypothetical protein